MDEPHFEVIGFIKDGVMVGEDGVSKLPGVYMFSEGDGGPIITV